MFSTRKECAAPLIFYTVCFWGAFLLFGCATPAMKVYQSAQIGQDWTSISGRQMYGGSPLHTARDAGAKSGYGVHYLVFTSDTNRVVAKAVRTITDTTTIELVIDGKAALAFDEAILMETRAHRMDGPSILDGGASRPGQDLPANALASGLDEKTWRLFAMYIGGWPGISYRLEPRVWVRGVELPWGQFCETLRRGRVDGVVRVLYRQDPIEH